MSLKFYGVLGVVFLGAYASIQVNNSLHYVEVEAEVVESKIDCFVKSGKSKLVKNDTTEMAYMDCDLAPIAAERFGYDQDDIKQRVQFTYEYYSPVDDSVQQNEATKTSSVEMYAEGAVIKVLAHKEKPSKSKSL